MRVETAHGFYFPLQPIVACSGQKASANAGLVARFAADRMKPHIETGAILSELFCRVIDH
ncbi:hypothetical protein AC244_17535 [Ensifer adhaerens]|uniref:Uncharacterized protein n=1 Tax=Ensifer adhaerens TaxID=106592 RepID=A0A0L8BS48_ENSAD|nr:hypothetical protein AC244_17535 [Ensifer adhaerens]